MMMNNNYVFVILNFNYEDIARVTTFLYIMHTNVLINCFSFWLQHNGGYESQPKNVNNFGRSKQQVSIYIRF